MEEYTVTMTYIVKGTEEDAIGFLDLMGDTASESDYNTEWLSETHEERE